MNDDLIIEPIDKYFSQVSFVVTTKQAAELQDNLRMSNNCQFGVAKNPHNFGPVPSWAMLLTAVRDTRRRNEEFVRDYAEELEGLS